MSSRDQAAAAVLLRLAMACDGVILGITLAVFAGQTWIKYRFSSNALNQVRHAPSPNISDLRSVLLSSSDDQDPSSSSGGKLVIVHGVVQEDSFSGAANNTSLASLETRERAVVVQRTQTCLYNEWRGIFGWSVDLHALFARSRKEPHSFSLRSVPFILTGDDTIIHVNLDGSTQPLPLTTVYHQMIPVQSIASPFLQILFNNGFPVAILDEEKILPVGKSITAIGICKLKNGNLEIKSSDELPCFMSDMKKNEIEADISLNTNFLFWTGILLGSLSVGIMGYAFRRNWQRWKEWRQHSGQEARQASEPNGLEEVAEDDDEIGDIPDGQLCVVCLTLRKVVAFTPCGHLACCPSCARSVVREVPPKCPLCRQNVSSSIRIYAS